MTGGKKKNKGKICPACLSCDICDRDAVLKVTFTASLKDIPKEIQKASD